MQVPLRLLLALRPSVAPALLVAIGSSTVVFTATPFLLPAIAEDRNVSLALAGWVSTAQLAGFVIASWLAGRFLRPIRSVFVTGATLGVVANLCSSVAPSLATLAISRFASGLSLGLAAWFAWRAAFGNTEKTGDVAVIGPLVGTFSSPIIAVLIEAVGVDWLFVVLAVVAASPLAFARRVSTTVSLTPHVTRHAATRAARVILLALALATMGGSSVFVFAAAIGQGDAGLSPFVVSLLFSANALVSIPAARWKGRRGPGGMWFAATAVCALLIASTDGSQIAFIFGLVVWGFVFWMGLPAIFTLLAARSRFPEERAGDAQAVMALGRVFGPLFGGALIAHGSTATLGGVAAGIMCSASLMLLYVDRDRFVLNRGQSHAPTVKLITEA